MVIECNYGNPLDSKLEKLKNELDLHIRSLMRHENQNYEPLIISDSSQQNIRIAILNHNDYTSFEYPEVSNDTDFLHAYCLNRNIQVSEILYCLQLTTNAAYELLAVLKLEGH